MDSETFEKRKLKPVKRKQDTNLPKTSRLFGKIRKRTTENHVAESEIKMRRHQQGQKYLSLDDNVN